MRYLARILNNGSVSPTSLNVAFNAAPNGSGSENRFTAWITFRAGRATQEAQGEIHAFFREGLVTLKLRIVPQHTD